MPQFLVVGVAVGLLTGCKPSTSTSPDKTVESQSPTPAQTETPAAGTKGVTEIVTAPARKSPPPYNNVFVVCVGVNKNPAWPTLQFAVNDATALAEVFRSQYGFTNVTLLTDSDAGRENVLDAIRRARSQLSPDGRDDFIFIYSGHGETWTEGIVSGGETNVTRFGFLLTYDAGAEKPATLADFRSRYLEMGELARQLAELPARHRLMFVDSCFSGLAFVQRELVNSRVEELYEDVIATPTVQIMTAGLDTEPVLEDSGSGHGIFTDALLQQIRPGDVRTMEEVFFPLRLAVRKNLERINKPMSMTPQHRYLLYTNGTFVFVPSDKRESWAAVRPDGPVIKQAEQNGYFKPVTVSEATNVNALASTQSPEQWQSQVDRYEARAAMGDPYANIALAQIYDQGIGVPANTNRAQIYKNESSDFLTASRTLDIASLLGIKDPMLAALLRKLVPMQLPLGAGGNLSLVDTQGKSLLPKDVTTGLAVADAVGVLGGGTATTTPPAESAPKTGNPLTGLLNRPNADVKIPFQGQEIPIHVALKGVLISKLAKSGVAAMQIGDFATAVRDLSAAVTDKPKNESYRFALAVALEITGDYAGARTHYTEANRLAGGSGMIEAQEGLKRITARGK